ncbi:hypothetical protein BaRGS_00031722 [Batillaria attramentaria]|uniref:Uncharacterized protein n=1 Tax=Batillaria attramentaria TaxID=370345 RepID=A0ABD0JQA4_9CAEN
MIRSLTQNVCNMKLDDAEYFRAKCDFGKNRMVMLLVLWSESEGNMMRMPNKPQKVHNADTRILCTEEGSAVTEGC